MNNSGEIFVNGRKIDELQLGSRSFMHGNSKTMLENLPYYTVKDVKCYELDTDSIALPMRSLKKLYHERESEIRVPKKIYSQCGGYGRHGRTLVGTCFPALFH